MHTADIEFLPIEQVNTLKQLLSCEKIHIHTKTGGGNSKVFCIEAEGKKWAVKSYPPYAPNQRDRLAAEYSVYQFLNQHQITAVPGLKGACETYRLLVMEWIEGSIPHDYSYPDIQQAILFLRQIAQLNTSATANTLPLAAEACLSLDALILQISKRFERLYAISLHEPALNDFLLNTFNPIFEQCQKKAKQGYNQHHIDTSLELKPIYRSLIPADFGFHNTLRHASGQLYFFDFDYFGWDDPVKLLADILWHPKMSLSADQKKQFIEGLSDIYNQDPSFLIRFHYTISLFGLRWVLILLNEFIPAFWQNREHAEAHQNQLEAKKKQLERAKALLKQINAENWI